MVSKKNQREKISQTPFSVSARVAMQLGRESISNSIIALLELVKNAYDADAENVIIRFKDIEGLTPSMIIQDDGAGMTLKQITDNWMVIGTNNKAAKKSSDDKQRVFVGEKGLGRLGIDRLSHKAKIQSYSSSSKDGVEVEIDWGKYDKSPNERLEKIKHDIYKIPKLAPNLFTEVTEPIKKGTRIELTEIKDIWSKNNLQELRNELSLLLSPFGSVNDFSIWLFTGSPNYKELDGRIETSEMAEAAEWTLESKIDDQGNVIHNLKSFTGVEFSYNNSWDKTIKSKEVLEKPRCGPLEFKMYFFDRKNPDLTTGEVRKFLSANQGIRIYRDEFRVKPYGDPSGQGDWLNLALRRVQNPKGVTQEGTWVVGYNQVVGAVFLQRERNDALLDQTNREGIVEGLAFYDLRRYALNAVEFFEDHRQKYERSQKTRRKIEQTREEAKQNTQEAINVTQGTKKELNKLERTIKKVLPKLSKKDATSLLEQQKLFSASFKNLESTVSQSSAKQDELIREAEEQEQEYEERKNTLGNLASLGILAAAFGHETVGYAKEVIGNINLLKTDVQKLYPILLQQEDHEVNAQIDNIDRAARRINTFAAFTLDNVRRDKRKRKDTFINQIIKDVFTALNLEEIYNIKVNLEFEEDLPKISVFPIDWESVFINLATNSKWAIDNSRNIDSPRLIRVRVEKSETSLLIKFADSGHGIPHHIVDKIFEPGYSTKTNVKGDVIGTGMGLSIVKSFVESYGGTLHVEPECDLGGAEFVFQIPVSQSKSE
ncbi:MAG: Sensor histidine kinase RcsC [Anaerolineales bacterium]|nr:Sensor histidine kinase RcsC [Anaerolineales bacterium]